MRNGISVSALSEFVHETRRHPSEAEARYGVELVWETGTRSQAQALGFGLGPHVHARDFRWTIDEPRQLLGHNHGPNPQELLLSAFGACLLVAFTVAATTHRVVLERLAIAVRGELDLRGFLGEAGAPVGLRRIRYTLTVVGEASPAQLAELHRLARQHSPNAQTLGAALDLQGELVLPEADRGRRPCPDLA